MAHQLAAPYGSTVYQVYTPRRDGSRLHIVYVPVTLPGLVTQLSRMADLESDIDWLIVEAHRRVRQAIERSMNGEWIAVHDGLHKLKVDVYEVTISLSLGGWRIVQRLPTGRTRLKCRGGGYYDVPLERLKEYARRDLAYLLDPSLYDEFDTPAAATPDEGAAT